MSASNPTDDAPGGCVWVDAICPECANLNRAARRACRYCDHSGFVKKSVPIESERA